MRTNIKHQTSIMCKRPFGLLCRDAYNVALVSFLLGGGAGKGLTVVMPKKEKTRFPPVSLWWTHAPMTEDRKTALNSCRVVTKQQALKFSSSIFSILRGDVNKRFHLKVFPDTKSPMPCVAHGWLSFLPSSILASHSFPDSVPKGPTIRHILPWE